MVSEVSNNVWNSVKIVVDKETLSRDIYFNGTLVKSGMATWFNVNTIPNICSFMLVLQSNLGYETELYLDDLKVYQAE